MRSRSRPVPDRSPIPWSNGQEDRAVAVETSATGAAEKDEAAPGRAWTVARARYWEPIAQWMFIVPAGAYLLLFFGYPIVKNVVMSFQQYTTTTFYTGAAPFVGLRNYSEILSSALFSKALLTTVLFTAGSIAGQFVLGLAFALFFHRRFPLGGVLRSLLLLPWLLPLVVSATTWKWMLDTDTGVVNDVLRDLHLQSSGIPWLTGTSQALVSVMVVNIWVGIPFNTTILYSGLQEIPAHLYEAAKLDGAGPMASFRHVTWPLLRPAVNVVLVLGAVYTVKVLDLILVVTGEDRPTPQRPWPPSPTNCPSSSSSSGAAPR